MSSEIEDTKEWADLSDAIDELTESLGGEADSRELAKPTPTNEDKRNTTPGQVSQYTLYGSGYATVNDTVKVLPPGCYDINSDSKEVYVTKALKPSGLLLELPEMRSEDVIKLSDIFWNSEKDYKEGNEFVIGGAAFKAGIMIYGPPGSGKSCTIKLVSNKLVARNGIVFYASCHPGTVIAFLTDFAKIEDNRKSIVVLEDFDSLIQQHGESSYLEMLDSAKTVNNVLFIATTNYPERLDPRIYNRPGRFSHVMKIGLPGAKTREAYLKAILKNHRDVDEIVSKSAGFTIDHLTALVNSVYREKKDLAQEIERLKTLFKVPKSEEKPMGIGVERKYED